MKNKGKLIKIFTTLGMLIALLGSPKLAVLAAGPAVGMTQSSGVNNQIVYLDLEMLNCTGVTSVAVKLDYDMDQLEFMADNCSFATEGTIQDFDLQKGVVLWASEQAKDLSGSFCELVFRIREDAPAGDSGIRATVIAKSNEDILIDSVAATNVTINCEHIWDEGHVEKEATASENGIYIYNCTKCSATKSNVIEATGTENGSGQKPAEEGKPSGGQAVVPEQNPNHQNNQTNHGQSQGTNQEQINGNYSYNSIRDNEQPELNEYLAQKRQEQMLDQFNHEDYRQQLQEETQKLMEEADNGIVNIGVVPEEIPSSVPEEIISSASEEGISESVSESIVSEEVNQRETEGTEAPVGEANEMKPFLFVILVVMICVIGGVIVVRSVHFGKNK